MPRRTDIVAALQARGVPVEVIPGWQTRGSSSFAPKGVVCHWTAGPRGTTTRPSLNVCVNGRPDLPGPLCNVYLDRRGVAVVVAAGRANHAGTGGKDGLAGNSSVYGIEAECGGDGDWTAEQRKAYPRVVAALLDTVDAPASRAYGHHEWAPNRKIDIRDYTMNRMRSEVASVLAADTNPSDTTNGGDDVPTLKEFFRGKGIPLEAGKERVLLLDDAGKAWTFCFGDHNAKLFMSVLSLGITGLPVGKEVQVRAKLIRISDGKEVGSYNMSEIVGTPGGTFGQYLANGRCPKGYRVRYFVTTHVPGVSISQVSVRSLEWVES
jgi:hypothetical protein